MRRHAVVQAGAAGQKTFRLGVEGRQEAHELGHHLRWVPGRTERSSPTSQRAERHEVDVGDAVRVGRRGEHAVDRFDRGDRSDAPITMKRARSSCRAQSSVPCHHVERRMLHLGGPQVALEFRDQRAGCFLIVERRAAPKSRAGWRACSSRRAEPAAAAPRRSSRRCAARRSVRQPTRKRKPRGRIGLARRAFEDPELGDEAGAALLRQYLCYRRGARNTCRSSTCWRRRWRHAGLRRHVAVAAERDDARTKSVAFFGIGNGTSAAARALLRRRRTVRCGSAPLSIRLWPADAPPTAGCDRSRCGGFVARRREGGAGDQLGIEPVRRLLRAVAPDRQRARHASRELVAKAGLVAEVPVRRPAGWSSVALASVLARRFLFCLAWF